MNVLEVNSLVLAYLGDGIYENYVRAFLINKKIANVNDLQKASLEYVSAKNQAKFLEELLDMDFFNEEELAVIHRARNYKSGRHPKNCDILTYKHATALEAVIGYLTFVNNTSRVDDVMNYILGGKIC
ncbi:MAG: ribonuclease III domain-containing protein [Bacilli bacterium]